MMDRVKRFMRAALESEVPANHPLMPAYQEIAKRAHVIIDAGLQSIDKDVWAMFDVDDPFIVEGHDEKVYFITVNMQAYPKEGEAFDDGMKRVKLIWPGFFRTMVIQAQQMADRFPNICIEDASDRLDQIFHLVLKQKY